MPGETPMNGRLDGWKEIAAYVNRSPRTLMRWADERGLPVRRIPGGRRQAVFARTVEIDAWLESKQSEGLVAEDERRSYVAAPISPSTATLAFPNLFLSRRGRFGVLCLCALAVLAVGLIHWSLGPRIKIIAERQLTEDHFWKVGLVTNGRFLYFGESQNGQFKIAEIPAQGGPTRRLTMPFVQGIPLDISRDGKQLLVLAWETVPQDDRALWIVPLDGTVPRRVGSVMCHSAAWSPDGRQIAFAAEKALYLTNDEGLTAEPIQTFDHVPGPLRWSLDGKRLRLEIQDERNERASFWQLTMDGDKNGRNISLAQLSLPLNAPASMSNLVSDRDDAFVGHESNGSGAISYLHRSRIGGKTEFERIELTKRIGWVGHMVADPASHRLFVVASPGGYSEMVRFDPTASEFRPFLPGSYASYVDFSRDGRSIAYVTTTERELWVSKVDGRDPHLITTPEHTDLELPRWSPDGKFIAFMARIPGRPYRIFMLSLADGAITEAAEGTDDQGAPTWSPDGKWLVYGNVLCQSTHTCAIRMIELATKRESTIPGSEGLGTARWSPDGRYIAALEPKHHQVFLLDIKTSQWRRIADSITGNDLSWSPNSRLVYASCPLGEKPALVKISVKDGTTVRAVDLSELTKLPGEVDSFFAMAPDNSIILLRLIPGDEVYELDYRD
jgi:Tol biopolymer transport system component